MPLIERLRQLGVVHWLGLSIAVMALEYYTGPFVQFAILLVFPVTIATVLHGIRVGIALAVGLPLLRLSFFATWPLPSSWGMAVADALIDVVILGVTAALIEAVIENSTHRVRSKSTSPNSRGELHLGGS